MGIMTFGCGIASDGDWRGKVEGHTYAVMSLASPSSRTVICWRVRVVTKPSASGMCVTTTTCSMCARCEGIRRMSSRLRGVRMVGRWQVRVDDGTVRLWNPEQRHQLRRAAGAYGGSPWSVAWSPDGRILASGSSDNTIRLCGIPIRTAPCACCGDIPCVLFR